MQTIGGVQRTSLVDYPEKVACTVFFNGCNFRCGFCHNPFLILNYKANVSKETFFNFLDSRKKVLDGVVLSGGEPCSSSDIIEFVDEVKKRGLLVKLDTNGSFPEILDKVIDKVDYVAMDIKSSLENYKDVVNIDIDLEKIKRSVEMIMDRAKDYEFRTTVIKSLFSEKVLREIGEWLKGAKRYTLQQFDKRNEMISDKFKGDKLFTEKEFYGFAEIAREYFSEVAIRNL